MKIRLKQYFSLFASSLLLLSLLFNVIPMSSNAKESNQTTTATKSVNAKVAADTPKENKADVEKDERVIGHIDFKIVNEAKTKVSVMDEYLYNHTAEISKNKAGQYFATVTFKNRSWWVITQTRHSDGVLKDVGVVKEYDEGELNLRVVKFPIKKDFTDEEFWVHIVILGIPGFTYDNKYTTFLQYTTPLVEVEAEKVKQNFQIYNEEKTALSPGMKRSYGNEAQVYLDKDDERHALITASSADLIKWMKVKKGNEFVEAKVYSENKEEKTRVYDIPIGNDKKLIEIQTRVEAQTDKGPYESTYVTHFDFDNLGISTKYEVYNENKTALLVDGVKLFGEEGNTVYDVNNVKHVNVTVANADQVKAINYKEAGKFVEAKIVSENKEENTKTFNIPVENEKALQEIEYVKTSGNSQVLNFDFGKVGISKLETTKANFQIYNEGKTGLSSGMKRSYGNEAQVYVNEKGQRHALITASSADLIKWVKVKQGNEFVEAKVHAENKEEKTRVYDIALGNDKNIIETQTRVEAQTAEGPYASTYVTHFDFDNVGITTNFEVYNEEKTALLPNGTTIFGDKGHTVFDINNVKYVDVTVTNANEIKSLNYKENDKFIEAKLVKEDKLANTKTFNIPVKNEKVLQEIQYVQPTGDPQIVYFDFGKIGIKVPEPVIPGTPGTPETPTTPTTPPTTPGTPTTPTPPTGGTEQIGTKTFKILDESKTKESYMNQYINHTANIVRINGQQYAQFTLTSPHYWVDIKIDGSTPTVISENATSKVIQVPLNNFTADMKWAIHIIVLDVPGLNYDHHYITYLKFDDSTPFPTTPGTPGTPGTPTTPGTPGTPNPTDVVETVGTETFKVLTEDKLKESSMARYIKNSAKIIKINNKQYAEFTLLSPAYWKAIKINGVIPTIISENKDERVVRVALDATNVDVKLEVTISVPEQNYEGSYTTYIVFDKKDSSKEEVVGEHSFKVMTEDKSKVSTMADYMTDKVKEIKVDGKQYAEFTLKSPEYWKELKINGIVPTVISETKDQRIVRIPLEDFTKELKVESHIVVAQINYDNKYVTYIVFDKVTKPTEPVDPNKVVSKSNAVFTLTNTNKKTTSKVHKYIEQPIVIEKTEAGKYIAKVTLKEAKMWKNLKAEVNGKMVNVKVVSTKNKTNKKVVSFEVSSQKANVKITYNLDTKIKGLKGKYTNYIALGKKAPTVAKVKLQSTTKYNFVLKGKDNKTTSAHNRYTQKPVVVEKYSNGKQYAVVTLQTASKWSNIKADINGKMKAVTTVSTNKKKNTKVIKFQVKSIKSNVKLTYTYNDKWKMINGKQTNYLKFNEKFTKKATEKKLQKATTKVYNYTIVKETKKGKSVANDYVTGPITVKKDSKGEFFATVNLKNAKWWKSFKTTYNGKSTNVKTVSQDKKKDTKVMTFQIADPSKNKYIKSNVHIVIPSLNYNNKYVIYFKVGAEQKKVVQVSNKIVKVSNKMKNKSFIVLKDKTNQTSYMDQYLVKPAKVYKKNGKQYVRMTLKNSKWWIYVKVKYGKKYTTPKVVSQNKKKNTRTIEFRVSGFKKKIYVKSHIIVPKIKYNHKYTTQIKFS